MFYNTSRVSCKLISRIKYIMDNSQAQNRLDEIQEELNGILRGEISASDDDVHQLQEEVERIRTRLRGDEIGEEQVQDYMDDR